MEKEDKSFIISVLQKHESAILGVMIVFFTWIVVQIFTLKEAQAVQQTDIGYIKETVNKIYDRVK